MKKAIMFLMLVFAALSLQAKVSDPEIPLSFIHPPFISPKILKDLCTWISDGGDQVVAINLLESQEKNRYFGDIQTRKNWAGKYPCVYVNGEGKEFFSYQLVGQTSDGIYVIQTSECTGGSGVFENLLLVTFAEDKGVTVDWNKKSIRLNRKRLLMKKLGAITLGDRWRGDLKVEGNKIFIGKDEGIASGKNQRIDGRSLDSLYWLEVNLK